MASTQGHVDVVRLLLEKGANAEAQDGVSCVETLMLMNNVACIVQNGWTPLMNAEQYCNGYEFEPVSALMVSLFSSAPKWRRRRVCVWLSSALSGGDNILYHLPTDVARICGSYL